MNKTDEEQSKAKFDHFDTIYNSHFNNLLALFLHAWATTELHFFHLTSQSLLIYATVVNQTKPYIVVNQDFN